MEITKDNITQAISALRQCAKEHKSDNIPTLGIIVSELCTDVADYLEKIKGADVIEIPSKCEIVKMADEWEINTTYASADSGSFIEGVEWLKTKIVK